MATTPSITPSTTAPSDLPKDAPVAKVDGTVPEEAGATEALSVKAVNPKTDADGKVSFVLPIAASEIASVEAVDVDLMIVTTKGERLLLPEAAISASTSANPKVSFSAGDTTDAASLFKKVGLLKPVVGGSFRLQATDMKPTPPAKPSAWVPKTKPRSRFSKTRSLICRTRYRRHRLQPKCPKPKPKRSQSSRAMQWRLHKTR